MSITTGSVSSATSASSNLGMQDFLRVLVTQLTYQDPLKPMDNQEFMAHIAQFTTLEQTSQLNSNIERLIANQASLQSVGLIGRTVEVTRNGSSVTGTVRGISFAGASPTLTVETTAGATLTGIDLGFVSAVR